MMLYRFKYKTSEILQIITTICLFTSLKRKCKLTHIMSNYRPNSNLSDKKDRMYRSMKKTHINHYVVMCIAGGLQVIIGGYPEDFRFFGGYAIKAEGRNAVIFHSEKGENLWYRTTQKAILPVLSTVTGFRWSVFMHPGVSRAAGVNRNLPVFPGRSRLLSSHKPYIMRCYSMTGM